MDTSDKTLAKASQALAPTPRTDNEDHWRVDVDEAGLTYTSVVRKSYAKDLERECAALRAALLASFDAMTEADRHFSETDEKCISLPHAIQMTRRVLDGEAGDDLDVIVKLRNDFSALRAALREYIAASDYSAASGDDIRALIRFGAADAAARALVEQ